MALNSTSHFTPAPLVNYCHPFRVVNLALIYRLNRSLVQQTLSPLTLCIESNIVRIFWHFDSPCLPNTERPVRTVTSSKVGQNLPHAATEVCYSTLNLETRNSKSSGHLLMKRLFDEFKAFLIPASVTFSE